MPSRDMAVATGALVLFRLLGSATGVAIGGTILNNQLAQRLSDIPGYAQIDLQGNVQNLIHIQPPELRDRVLSAYAAYISVLLKCYLIIFRSIDTIWIVMTPLAGVGLLCVLMARKYTLKRNFVKAGDLKAGNQRPGSPGSGAKQTTTESNDSNTIGTEKIAEPITNSDTTKEESEA